MLLIKCPHCDRMIEILEINCAIFRCGIYKNNYSQVNPHATKEQCDKLAQDGLIYGCGKPFKVVDGVAVECGYI